MRKFLYVFASICVNPRLQKIREIRLSCQKVLSAFATWRETFLLQFRILKFIFIICFNLRKSVSNTFVLSRGYSEISIDLRSSAVPLTLNSFTPSILLLLNEEPLPAPRP